MNGLLWSLLALPLAAAITDVRVLGTTSTQTVIAYTAPDDTACRVEMSESASYLPLAHDVDGALFPGANLDSRTGNISNGRERVFVAGQRKTQRAADGKAYSRALQAYTRHYYRITCGPDTVTGTFTTDNIPLGMTYRDLPPMDPDQPGDALIPTLTAINTVIDPMTGLLIKQAQSTLDTVAAPKSIFLDYGGHTRMCGYTKVTCTGTQGYVCAFPKEDGNAGSLYFAVPATGEMRYLGYLKENLGGTWLVSQPRIRMESGIPVLYRTTNSDEATPNQLRRGVIADYCTEKSAGAAASVTWSAHGTTDIPGLFEATNATFDETREWHCKIDYHDADPYGVMHCNLGSQDSVGWLGLLDFSVASPSSLTAAKFVSATSWPTANMRWCGIHYGAAMGASYVKWDGKNLTGSGGNPAAGMGPYQTTLAAEVQITDGSITVAGEPRSAFEGDEVFLDAAVGDWMRICDGSSCEVVKINGKNGPLWGIDRAQEGTAAKYFPAGSTVRAYCPWDGKITYWKWDTDELIPVTGAADSAWGNNGHSDWNTTNLFFQEDYHFRTGAFGPDLALSPEFDIPASAAFAGQRGVVWGAGPAGKHPSYHQADAGEGEQGWFLDALPLGGAPQIGAGYTPISGQLYKYTKGAWFASDGTGFTEFQPKLQPIYVVSDYHMFRDVSPGPIATDSSGNYTWCLAQAADECVAGSVTGDLYFNTPDTLTSVCHGSDNGPIPGSADICAFPMPSFASGIAQFGFGTANTEGLLADDLSKPVPARGHGYTRFLTDGLGGLRRTSILAKPLPDASWFFFHIQAQNTSAWTQTALAMAKLPPTPAHDSLNRTTFYPVRVEVGSVPAGTDRITAEFGYAEYGTRDDFYCTSRRESCVAASTSFEEGHPFSWLHESPQGVECSTGCGLIIPALPQRVLYYRLIFHDTSGAILHKGETQLRITP